MSTQQSSYLISINLKTNPHYIFRFLCQEIMSTGVNETLATPTVALLSEHHNRWPESQLDRLLRLLKALIMMAIQSSTFILPGSSKYESKRRYN